MTYGELWTIGRRVEELEALIDRPDATYHELDCWEAELNVIIKHLDTSIPTERCSRLSLVVNNSGAGDE